MSNPSLLDLELLLDRARSVTILYPYQGKWEQMVNVVLLLEEIIEDYDLIYGGD